MIGLLKYLIWRRRMNDPERLIDAVIVDMERRLTEARLQMLAVDIAKEQISQAGNIQMDEMASEKSLAELETALKELRSKRNLLIARARDADARLAIEKALLSADREPARVAMDMLSQRTMDSQSEADAIEVVRSISTGNQGQDRG